LGVREWRPEDNPVKRMKVETHRGWLLWSNES
jgi:hypothetical protein